MKKQTFKTTVIIFLIFFQFPKVTFSQANLDGIWEGLFMNDFKTIVELKSEKGQISSGNIKMFNGEIVIQDDPLSKMSLEDVQFDFYIEAKETGFKGIFDQNFSKLTGVFIFPDKSEHPIELLKNNNIQDSEENNKNAYLEMKNTKFSEKELISDLDFLIQNLINYHPRLYAFTSENEFKNKVEDINQSISEEMTRVEYLNLIVPLTDIVKCSHTGICLPEAYQKSIEEYGNFIPLKIVFIGDKMMCTENLKSGSQIIPGSEIISINDVPAKAIKDKIFKFIPSEGNNTSTKNFFLNQNFNFYFSLIDDSDSFLVEFKNSGSLNFESLKACYYSDFTNENLDLPESPVQFRLEEEGSICWLTVNSFQFPDVNKYIVEMDDIFTTIQLGKIRNLILDLRGNSGGHPIFAAQLFSYLTDKKFIWFRRNKDVEEFEPLYNEMEPSKLHFNGALYVLTDGGSLSTTGHLLSLIENYTNAIFIGEEPGSNYICNDNSIKTNLPNTGIVVNIPRSTFMTTVKKPEKLNPSYIDYEIYPSINDYLTGKDEVMNFVQELILNKS